MSANTSEVAGFLTEVATVVPDRDLADAITGSIVGCTKLNPTLVRPRWQPLPPNQPAADVDWCSVGVIRHEPMDYPYEIIDPNGNGGKGELVVTDYINLDVLVSFYGPNAERGAGLLRRGLLMGQNRFLLYNIATKVTEIGQIQVVPDQVNLQIIDHIDLSIRLVREIKTRFNVDYLLSAEVHVHTDTPPPTVPEAPPESTTIYVNP